MANQGTASHPRTWQSHPVLLPQPPPTAPQPPAWPSPLPFPLTAQLPGSTHLRGPAHLPAGPPAPCASPQPDAPVLLLPLLLLLFRILRSRSRFL